MPPQRSLISPRLARIPLDLVILGLLLWLPVETWVLRFLPSSDLLLIVPDLLSLGLGLALVFALVRSGAVAEYGHRARWLLVPILALAVTASVSALVNRVAPLEFAYWARVYLRFVPLAAVAACPPWTDRIGSRLTAVVALSLGFQLEISLFQIAMGRRAAELFWPGLFQLGSVQTTVSTLAGVQDRFVAGTLGHYNILAWYIVVASAVLVSRLLSSKPLGRLPRAILSIELLVSLSVLTMSQSRQAFFVVMLAAVPLALYVDHEYGLRSRARLAYSKWNAAARHMVPMIAVALILVIGVIAAPHVSRLEDRYSSLFTTGYWKMAGDNRGYAIGTIVPRVALSAPVLGVGPGSFGREWTVNSSTAPPAVKRLDLDLHHWRYLSDVGWASVFAQIGLLGALSLLVLLFAVARVIWENRHLPTLVVLASVVFIMLGPGMVAGAPLTYKATSSLFWVVAGIVFGLSSTRDPSISPEVLEAD